MIGDPIFWTAVAAVSASLSSLFAALYTWLTFRLVRSLNEPNVILYVRHDESRPTILQIVIENIGRGLATDIRFTSSRSIPWHAWNSTTNESGPVQPMAEGPLINGIAALAPGDARKLSWGQYKGLKQALGGEPIIITCTYNTETVRCRLLCQSSRLHRLLSQTRSDRKERGLSGSCNVLPTLPRRPLESCNANKKCYIAI
jgi:hypothetical protein